jgi:hypothetical protein
VRHGLLAILLLAGACAPGVDDGLDPTGGCQGDKCDLPDDPAEVSCNLRRGEALSQNQAAFTPTALRWSCNDARGVTAADRGQEYCEYFAVVQPPAEPGGAAGEPQVLGRNLGDSSAAGTTPTAATLTGAERARLEDDAATVVGQCVFTTWNSDIDRPVSAEPVAGLPVTARDFRMKFEVNSADAAQILVSDCAVTDAGNEIDDFTRACMLNEELNGTAFRKSDSTVCSASMRLAECGCALRSGGDLAAALSPFDRRGFPLGTWSSPTALPPSCRYVELGDGSRTVVTCDLTAGDLLASLPDPKARCRDKYADNVVVHVPIPADQIACTPPPGGANTRHCGTTPWVVQP